MSLEHSPVREAGNRSGNIGRMLISDLELAEILGCSRATIWRRVAGLGCGPCTPPGRWTT